MFRTRQLVKNIGTMIDPQLRDFYVGPNDAVKSEEKGYCEYDELYETINDTQCDTRANNAPS